MPLLRTLVAIAAAFVAGQSQAADLPGPIIIKQAIVTNNPCADPMVRRRIAERFAWAERHTWHRGFVMASLSNGRVGEHPFYEPGIVHREYCMADAKMTDGTARTVYYTIEFGQGIASLGNYVDFCVLGLDPWRVHDEACRAVR